MAFTDLTFASNNKQGQVTVKHFFSFFIDGDLADSGTKTFLFKLPFRSRFVDGQLSLDVTGTVGTDVVLDVTGAGTSVFSTTPKLQVAAADEATANVGASGTGIVAGVIDAANDNVAEDAVIKVTVASNGTFTTQPSDCSVVLEFAEEADFDPTV